MAKPCDMKLLEVKTARFTVVVEKCGAPEAYTLWMKPEADRRFQTLIKGHKIMTIQTTDAGTEFGMPNTASAKARAISRFRNR
jgi:hypothetical protein